MKIKWKFNLNTNTLHEYVGSSEEFLQSILNEIKVIMDRDDKPSNLETIPEIVKNVDPKSPGDVLLLGVVIGSWHAFNRLGADFDPIEQQISKAENWRDMPIEDCYNKEKFLKDMYNKRNDF